MVAESKSDKAPAAVRDGAANVASAVGEDALRRQLEEERARNLQLEATIKQLRGSTAALLNACEQAQEGLSNRLLREINRLKTAQLEMCAEVEEGEARLLDVLERRLRGLQTEKVVLENTLECEQERIVNRLQRQMDELRLAAGLDTDSASPSNKSTGSLVSPPAGVTTGSLVPPPPLELAEQINLAVAQHVEREAELARQIGRLQEENQCLVVENLRLKHRLRRQSIEESPIMSDSSILSNSPPARSRSRGSICELRRSQQQLPSDTE